MDRVNRLTVTNPAPTEAVSPADLRPKTEDPPASADESIDTPNPSSLAAKSMERGLEVAYFRGQLDQAQPLPGGVVLHGKTQHDSGSGAVATKHSSAIAASALVGQRLGTNQSGAEVKVARELGSPRGYKDKLQAIAAARMAGAEPAAVVQDSKGMWHAVETTAPADGISSVTPLPSFSQINNLSKEVSAIRQKLDKGENLSPQDRDALVKKLSEDRKQLASLLFAVPQSDIQFNQSPRYDNPDKINIDVIDPHRPGDTLGSEHLEGDKPFEPGLKPTFGIKLEELENPKEAAAVLFHEVSHRRDDELAQKWVQKYEKEGHIFVKGNEGRQAFKNWMDEQVKKEAKKVPPDLTQADSELVVNRAVNDLATTEARAYVHTALAALESGNPDLAAQQLKAYAAGIKSGKIASPATGSHVENALTEELQQAYRQLPPDMKEKLREAIAAAKQANSDVWISHVQLRN